jgi:hypothetical protein
MVKMTPSRKSPKFSQTTLTIQKRHAELFPDTQFLLPLMTSTDCLSRQGNLCCDRLMLSMASPPHTCMAHLTRRLPHIVTAGYWKTPTRQTALLSCLCSHRTSPRWRHDLCRATTLSGTSGKRVAEVTLLTKQPTPFLTILLRILNQVCSTSIAFPRSTSL